MYMNKDKRFYVTANGYAMLHQGETLTADEAMKEAKERATGGSQVAIVEIKYLVEKERPTPPIRVTEVFPTSYVNQVK